MRLLASSVQEMTEADYALLEWTLARTDAEEITLEYPVGRCARLSGEQAEALQLTLERLRELTRAA